MPIVSRTRKSSPNAIAAAVTNPISPLNALFDMLQRDLAKSRGVLRASEAITYSEIDTAGRLRRRQQSRPIAYFATSVSEKHS